MAEQKTNVMRILEQKKIPYQAHSYPHGAGPVDGAAVARLLGQDPQQVYKTLVTRGHSRGIYVFVIPVLATLDLKKAAKAAGEKSVEMIHVSEIAPLTGYVRGGCSPVGMKKRFSTFFDSAVEQLPTVMVSGGKIGWQVEVEPGALLKLVGAQIAPLTVPEA
ncbi:MAG: Cys-tRNA(Pro) deacylase [Oscillospiraceae bacterium]|nr:Cys-tRNA(Pro) deacylase [Oscillospiraceae bacterium]